jgi:hypothetical protein
MDPDSIGKMLSGSVKLRNNLWYEGRIAELLMTDKNVVSDYFHFDKSNVVWRAKALSS